MSGAAKSEQSEDRPRLFISHKHADRAIAATLARFIKDKTAHKVQIHLSSESVYDGPRIGRNLNEELRKALWRTDALILLYTTEDQDWSYCMYECGLATDRDAPSSSIYVLQCGSAAPAPFMDTVRVNAREPDALKRFVHDLLRSTEFFPRWPRAIIPEIGEGDFSRYAAELHAQLKEVLPPIDPAPDESWRTWPFLTLEIASKVIDEVVKAQPETGCTRLDDKSYKALVESGIVTAYDKAQTPRLFGKANFPATLCLKDLVSSASQAPEGDAWVHCCLQQILKGAQRGFIVMGWAPLTDPQSGTQFLPALCDVRHFPVRGVMSFDVFFIDVLSPQAMPARNKMLAVRDIVFLDLDDPATRTRKLHQLRQEMQRGRTGRMPVLDRRNKAHFVVHKSLMDQFLLDAMGRPGDYGAADASDLNLGHLLDDAVCGAVAGKTFATVGSDATVSDVEKAMRELPGCMDVFVTADGTKDGAVLGWVTNASIGR